MQFAKRVRALHGNFGCKYPAALAGANLLAPGSAIDPSPALEFKQVTAIPQYGAPVSHSLQNILSFLCRHRASLIEMQLNLKNYVPLRVPFFPRSPSSSSTT